MARGRVQGRVAGGWRGSPLPLAIVGGALVALGLFAGCRSSGQVAEGGAALLRVSFPAGGPFPDELRAWVYDDTGVLFSAVRFPAQGTLPLGAGHTGTVLIQPGSSSGPLRVHLRGLLSSVRQLDGVLVVARTSLGQSAVDVAMGTAVPPDGDGDDVPDAIDDCPLVANPGQQACPGAPMDAAAPRDSGTPMDALAPPDTTAAVDAPVDAEVDVPVPFRDATVEAPPPDASPPTSDARDAGTFAGTAGCGTAPTGQDEGLVTLMLTEGGLPVARQFWLSRPTDYDPQRGYKLIVGLGSMASTADAVRQQLGLQAADAVPRTDEIFVYPLARIRAFGTWGTKIGWQLGPGAQTTNAAGNDDLAFVDAMLDDVGRRHCIDPTRIFVAGQGWGADFASALACARGNKLRAVTASTNNGDYYLRNPPVTCVGSTGTFLLQGKGDTQFPIAVGTLTLNFWLTQHACPRTTQPLVVAGPGGNEDCVRYTGCAAETRWCATDVSFAGAAPTYLGREAMAFFRSY
jgi:poly(3-hydroxybutyrate) depolymerase